MSEESALTKALATVQEALPAIPKTKTAKVKMKNGGEYSYKYADLGDIAPQIHPLLSKNGLAWITKPTFDDHGNFVLRYVMRHVSGETEGGDYPLPDPSQNTAQEIGSALTYARRYTLCCVTGIAPDEDVDGQGEAKAAKRQQKAAPVAQPTAAELTYTRAQMDVKKAIEGLTEEQRSTVTEYWRGMSLPKTEKLSDEQAQKVLGKIRQLLPVDNGS